jgi:HSP20 family molecular chaperone IbpA
MLLQPHQHNFVSIDAAVANLLESRFERPDEAFDPLGARHDLPVDILQTDDELVVRAAVPGFAPEDINVVVLGDALSLKGAAGEGEMDAARLVATRPARTAAVGGRCTIAPETAA